MGSFNLHHQRKTVVARFNDVDVRNNALDILNKEFVDVKFQKINSSDILINRTGSLVYDMRVTDKVTSLGGYFEF